MTGLHSLFGGLRGGFWRPEKLMEKTENLVNPCRGAYQIFRFYADGESLTKKDAEWTGQAPPSGQTLALLEINLRAYREGPLSPEALERIDGIIGGFAQKGLSLILRFVYDWEGLGAFYEPEEIGIILGHMAALGPVLKKWSRRIFVIQGLFTGSWGEMHNTRYGETRHMSALIKALADAAGKDTFLAVRCPSYWRAVFRSWEPISPREAYGGTVKARTGLYNDALLGSDTDLGTYGDAFKTTAESMEQKLLRRDEVRFQQQLCLYAPLGGETVNPSALNGWQAAAEEMRQTHFTYLNSLYDQRVLDQWRASPGPGGPWKEKTGYDYIEAHLGYRYLVEECRVNRLGGGVGFQIGIRNAGFAPCYRPVRAEILLRPETGEDILLPLDTDARFWLPGTVSRMKAEARELKSGRYQAGLRLRCALTGSEITLANTPDSREMTNPLGEARV